MCVWCYFKIIAYFFYLCLCFYSVLFYSPKPISITIYRDSFTGTLPYNLLNFRARDDCLKKSIIILPFFLHIFLCLSHVLFISKVKFLVMHSGFVIICALTSYVTFCYDTFPNANFALAMVIHYMILLCQVPSHLCIFTGPCLVTFYLVSDNLTYNAV